MADFAKRGLQPTAPIKASHHIKVTTSDLWAIISASGNLINVHPFCARNPVERWPGVDGADHVYYYSGIHYRRDVSEWLEGEGYELLVGPPTGKVAKARWQIQPTPTNDCKFSIEVISYVRSDVGQETRAIYEQKMIREAIPPYLEAVVKGVAYFAETGDPVRRNQFGHHHIYSPE